MTAPHPFHGEARITLSPHIGGVTARCLREDGRRRGEERARRPQRLNADRIVAQRWKHAPDGSRWGEFGPDDQRGRMNLVTPAKVLEGIAEVREGRTFCLSLPLDVPGGQAMNPRRIAPRRYAVLRDGKSAGQQGFCWSYASEDADLTDVVNDDVVLMSLQYSTQWDSLAHVGSRFDADGDGVAGGGVLQRLSRRRAHPCRRPRTAAAAEPVRALPRAPSADALGIERLAEHGVQGRGVLIDLEHHVGRTRQAVGYDALMRMLDADGVEVEAGDMVCVHTGFADTLLRDEPPARCRAAAPDRQRPRRLGRQAAELDRRRQAGLPARGQPGRRARRARSSRRPRRCASRGCRCTSTACSRTASTSASSGTCTRLADARALAPTGRHAPETCHATSRRSPIAFSLAATLLTLPAHASLQAQAWPAKPVKIIVPYPPGGSVDVVTRKMAAKLQEQTGQTFFVENKAGATGTIGLVAGRAGAGRRLHAGRQRHDLRAAAAHLQEAAVRPREGPGAGQRLRLRADERGRQGRLEVQDARRPDRRGQGRGRTRSPTAPAAPARRRTSSARRSASRPA